MRDMISKAVLIGGDMRQVFLALELAKDGIDVVVVGFNDTIDMGRARVSQEMSEEIKTADCVILPLPLTRDDKTLYAPYSETEILITSVLDAVTEQSVFAGTIPAAIAEQMDDKGILYYDYFNREELMILNAIPTAEGAIQIAMQETSITLSGSKCLVTGYGRIGKILAKMLQGIGAKTSVAVRKCSDRAWIKSAGLKPVYISELSEIANEYDIVFNTVPALILDETFLNNTKRNCLIIDLASKPGGVDFAAAEKLGIKVIWALSLPGQVAPLSSGRIIKETIKNILREEGECCS